MTRIFLTLRRVQWVIRELSGIFMVLADQSAPLGQIISFKQFSGTK